MDLSQAIRKHTEWRLKLRSAISNRETLDVATIAKDNCCELGKWLHGEGKALFGTLRAYPVCVAAHANFHVEAGRVAQIINSKRYDDAGKMLDGDTPYVSASTAVGVAIVRLKKEAGM